ncbi:uncharacterized protein LOC114914958 [Cajanus cajan]|uniref:uncharacterized protein LOC114914958 n=1 Tax=Cajanus cajan TaxID=3821 RepID=UPI0010FAFE16|nr:uncharacterized protein LOC114914958 [Cajanus cajan]
MKVSIMGSTGMLVEIGVLILYRDANNEKTNLSTFPFNDRNSLVIPGSVIWARTDNQIRWPVEIMEERSTVPVPASDGHVLVQFYGNCSSAWINPMTDVSSFEDSFEARSTHSSKDFHKALKHALRRKEQLSSCIRSSSDRRSHCNRQNHSSGMFYLISSQNHVLDRKAHITG